MNIELPDKYLLPTAMGAFYTVASNKQDSTRDFLRILMSKKTSVSINSASLNEYFSNIDSPVAVLHKIQKNGWIHGQAEKKQIEAGPIEIVFPELLEKISKDKKALLADDQGFCIVSTGYDDENSELLAALSTDLSVISLLQKNNAMDKLNIQSNALALVNMSGQSNVGFWPIYVGDSLFILVISGAPDFEQEAFVDLIWLLHQRYCVY